MSTTAYALLSDPSFLEFKKYLEDQISQIGKRFDILKQETETVLNKFAEDSKTLQESLGTLSKAQEETIKKLNIASDEIRSLGGKIIQRQDPAPVVAVKSEMGLSMFDLFEDE